MIFNFTKLSFISTILAILLSFRIIYFNEETVICFIFLLAIFLLINLIKESVLELLNITKKNTENQLKGIVNTKKTHLVLHQSYLNVVSQIKMLSLDCYPKITKELTLTKEGLNMFYNKLSVKLASNFIDQFNKTALVLRKKLLGLHLTNLFSFR